MESLPPDQVSMQLVALVAFGATLVRFVVAALAVMFLLKWWDWMNGQPFTRAQEIMNAHPLAVANYRGWRLLALCVLAGLVFS